MKKLGIVGGIGPESTVDYYRLFIKGFQEVMGEGNYPEILINSINMTKMLQMVAKKEMEALTLYITEALENLARAGADYAVIASNTPHIVFNEVQARSPIPLQSIVVETCKKAMSLDLKKVGLMGTSFTMQADYYAREFEAAGIAVCVPSLQEQEYIHTKIFSELQALIIKNETREGLLAIVKRMAEEEGIEGLILGCTELPLILSQDEFGITFLNTSVIHVEAALKYGLK